MSLFKAREWWTTVVGDSEMFDNGCLCVTDILNSGSDQIIVGSFHRRLSVYQPKFDINGGFKAEDIIFEIQFADPILQIETGRFVSGSSVIHLAVLHPRKLAVFGLSEKGGVSEHGTQYQLRSMYEHKLQRTSFNFCFGPFGGVKDRDFMCIQSIDGTISIFEQETFAFSRFLPGALLPGPIKYIRTIDSFVTATSSCQIDCYKFHKLARATDEKVENQSITKGKRVVADWSFIISEIGVDIAVTKFENCALTIFVLGERNLYALSDMGQLLFMKKLEYSPSCFLPFYSAKNDHISTMIAGHDSNLFVYQNITLVWAARLSYVPVQLRTATIQGVSGIVVTLDEQGHLSCCYLGTDPSIITHPSAYFRELNISSVEAEMKQLQTIIKEQQKLTSAPSLPTPSSASDDELKVTVTVPSGRDQVSQATDVNFQEDMPIPSVTVTIQLQAKAAVNNVKLTCFVGSPLVASDPVITIPAVAPGQPVERRVSFYMKYRVLPTDLKLTVLASYYGRNEAPRIVQSKARLPLFLVIRPCQPMKNAAFKITLDTNKSTVSLGDLFSDYWGSSAEASQAIGFKFFGLDPVITLLAAKSSQRYRVQCDNFGYMWHMLNELVMRLSTHFKMGSSSDFRLFYESPMPLQEYFEVIERHFNCRQKSDELAKSLEEHAAQFRAVQKRLLVMYKDKTPAPPKNLDVLFDSTYSQIMDAADAVESNNELLRQLSAELSCSTCIVNALLRLWLSLSAEDVRVLESVLSPVVNDGSAQGWEEMVDAAVMHLLRTTLSKSAKDIALNPSALTPLKDVHSLHKHIGLMYERLGKGAKLTEGSTSKPPVSGNNTRSENEGGNFDYKSLMMPQATKTPLKIPTSQGEMESAYSNHDGSQRFRKKSKKASDDVPDMDSVGNDVTGDSVYATNKELVYGLDA